MLAGLLMLADIWADCGGESMPGKENNTCKGTEVGLSLPSR